MKFIPVHVCRHPTVALPVELCVSSHIMKHIHGYRPTGTRSVTVWVMPTYVAIWFDVGVKYTKEDRVLLSGL